MKLIASFFLIAFSIQAFAADGVLEAFYTIIPEKSYIGSTPDNRICMLHILEGHDHVEVIAAEGYKVASYVIVGGTNYRFNNGRREFLSSDKKGTFRTLAVNEALTYTVTAEIDGSGKEEAIECIVRTVQ